PPFVSRQLERCLAVLGIRLVHSRPGQPQGRGKVERAFRTVREQFLVELDARGGARDLDELNRLFGAWVEGVYHHREHSETGQAPWSGSWPARHPACPPVPSCGRRSCGPSVATPPSRRWSARSATATTATPPRSA